MHIKFWLENLNERDHLGDISTDDKIIRRFILRKQGVDWIQPPKDRVYWQAFMNMVMNLQVG
jgi:hypothetical protein